MGTETSDRSLLPAPQGPLGRSAGRGDCPAGLVHPELHPRSGMKPGSRLSLHRQICQIYGNWYNCARNSLTDNCCPQNHCAKLLQSCPTLCNPMGCHIPGFSVQGIFQAIILEWVAMPSSKASSQPRNQIYVSCMDRWILYHRITWYMLNQSYSSAKYPSERDGFLQFNV